MKKHQKKLAIDIGIRFTVVTAVMLIGLLITTVIIVKKAFFTSQVSSISEIAKQSANRIGEWIKLPITELKMLASEDTIKTGDIEKIKQMITTRELSASDFKIDSIFAADYSGNAYCSEGNIQNMVNDEAFKAVVNNGKQLFIGNATTSQITGKPVIEIAMPIEKSDGTKFGVIGMTLPIDYLNTVISQIKIGKTGSALVVDGTGLMIANKFTQYVLKANIHESAKYGVLHFEKISENIKQGIQGYGIVKTNAGTALMDSSPIPGTPNWTIVVSVPVGEFYGVLNGLIPILIGISLFILVLMIIMSFTIARSVVMSINTAKDSIVEIAHGDADLTKTIEHTRQDEIGALMDGFNLFVNKLHDIVSQITGTQTHLHEIGSELGRNVHSTTEQIHSIIQNLKNIEDEGKREESSVEETSSSVTQITQNIKALDNLIETQAAGVTEASSSIEEMIGNIKNIAASMSKMEKEFNGLVDSTKENSKKQKLVAENIQKISKQSELLSDANKTISSISTQTNLLAMNAAIEAAHAGDAGKGFSVVADAIRKLSETSANQSKKIGLELKNIIATITTVVQSSNESEQTFSQMSDHITTVDKLVTEISQALSEQNEGSKQIFTAIRAINDTMSQVKNGSVEMASGSKSILDSVTELQNSSHTIQTSIREATQGTDTIIGNLKNLTNLADKTNSSIEEVESNIGQFKI